MMMMMKTIETQIQSIFILPLNSFYRVFFFKLQRKNLSLIKSFKNWNTNGLNRHIIVGALRSRQHLFFIKFEL